MIGLRARSYGNTVEVLALGPVWGGTVIRSIVLGWNVNAASVLEFAFALSKQGGESVENLTASDSLLGPGEEVLGGTAFPAMFVSQAANQWASMTFPIYVPVADGVRYVLVGCRTAGAQVGRVVAGLQVELERNIVPAVSVLPSTRITPLGAGVGPVLQAAAESARVSSGPAPVGPP